MKDFEIWLKRDGSEVFTNILVRAEDEKSALSIFRKQAVYIKGVKKDDYFTK